MTRTRFQSILQNLHFSNNDNDSKTDQSHKISPAIEHVNKYLLKTGGIVRSKVLRSTCASLKVDQV